MRLILLPLMLMATCSIAQVNVRFSIEAEADHTELSVFKFYISAVQLNYTTKSSFREKASYHLVDLATSSTHSFELPDALPDAIESITFTIGTDSATNVVGIMDGDLDPIRGMYWAWNTGYINFKLEGTCDQQSFEFHIGGYLPPSPTARIVTLPVGKIASGNIEISVHPLDFLNQLDLNDQHSVLVPGAQASTLADLFSTIFYTHE